MFWERFYNLCLQNGDKPNTVAKELGFSTAACTHWKEGAEPKSSVLIKIADYFDVSVDYLLGRTDDPESHKIKNELINTVDQLTEDNLKKVLEYYQTLKSEQK